MHTGTWMPIKTFNSQANKQEIFLACLQIWAHSHSCGCKMTNQPKLFHSWISNNIRSVKYKDAYVLLSWNVRFTLQWTALDLKFCYLHWNPFSRNNKLVRLPPTFISIISLICPYLDNGKNWGWSPTWMSLLLSENPIRIWLDEQNFFDKFY